jgi:translocation and assembly module TamB
MSRAWRVGRWLAAALAAVVLVVLAAVFAVANTDRGREWVRLLVLDQVNGAIDGRLEIGGLEGNLLVAPRLVDARLVDQQGRPFIDADRVTVGYSLFDLVRQRIVLTRLELEGARVVLDEVPGQDWNFVRIFVTDPDPDPDPEPGWGDWVEIRDVRVADSRVTLRTAWEPDEDLPPAEQERERERARAGETMDRVVEVPEGLQRVMDFRELHGEAPRILAVHPDTAGTSIEIAHLSAVAEVFRTPPALLEDLSGLLRIGEDTLAFHDVRAALPGSRLRGEGYLHGETGEGLISLAAEPVSLADFRFLAEGLPADVSGDVDLAVHLREDLTHLAATGLDFRVGEGRLQGRAQVSLGELFRVDDTDLRFAGIDTGFLEEAFPGLELARRGVLSGHLGVTATGEPVGGVHPVEVDLLVAFDDVEAGTSRILAAGTLVPDVEDAQLGALTVRLDPLDATAIRALAPEVPIRGTIEGFVTVDGPVAGPLRVESALTHRDPVAGTSRVTALGGIDLREELRFDGLLVGLDRVQLDLAREYLEEVPARSTVSGFVRLDGPPAEIVRVESELAVDDPASGISRIAARGGIGPMDGPAFQDFEARLEPLQVSVLETFVGELPIGGILEARALLDGAPDTRLAYRTELVHTERRPGDAGDAPAADPPAPPPDADPPPLPPETADELVERTHLLADGSFTTAGDGHASAEIDVRELSLVTAGRFAPEAGLRGSASGRIEAEGSFQDLAVRADLLLPAEGTLRAEGRLVLEGEEPVYRMAAELGRLDFASLTTRMEDTTAVTGAVRAEGRGTDPERASASVRADLVDEADPERRALLADLTLDRGLLEADTLALRIPHAQAHLRGTFGLTPEIEGEMRYLVLVDSLHVLSGLLPGEEPDTLPVTPRPAVHEEAAEDRRQELYEAVRAAEVEHMATGERPDLPEGGDTLALLGIRRDVLAGTAGLSGSVRGHLERIDVEGDLVVDDLLLLGHRVGYARAEYDLVGLGEQDPVGTVGLEAGDLVLAGFGYRSLSLTAQYRGRDLVANDEDGAAPRPPARHRANVALDLVQDELTEIRAVAELDLAGDGEEGELVLADLAFSVPGAEYHQPHPAVVRWSGEILEVRDFRLESDLDALVLIHGSLPRDEAGELDVLVRELEIAHVLHLLQEREGTRALLDLEARGNGTMAEPVFDAEAGLSMLALNGRLLPDVRASVAYRPRELTGEALVVARTGETMVRAEARLPVDLSLVDPDEPRLRDEPLRVAARIDDLALETVAALTDQLESVIGTVDGYFTMEGTFEDPDLEGALTVDAPTMFVVPLGIRLGNVVGSFTFRDEVLAVDSLVAWSRGPVRLAGQVRLPWLEAPEFDLAVEARDARVMNTDDVRLRIDADLTVAGPYEALEVAGAIRTRRGVIRIPESEELAAPGPLDLEDPAVFARVDPRLVAARDALIDPDPLLENLTVDVAINIERDMWIRSTEANIELFTPPEVGPLRVRMTGLGTDLRLEGVVNTDRGEYAFMGRRFDLARGSVTFGGEPEPDPVIRLTAEHEVQMPAREAFDIRIIVEGTVADLETELESTSQPPLSQTDLLSFLVFGRDAGSLLQRQGSAVWGQGTAGGPLVGAVAARAAQQFATVGFHAVITELEVETARALGLDVLHIQPADLPAEVSTGEFIDLLRGTEVEAGAYLTPRLFVSGQARPTFVHPGARVDYLTDRGWTWRATWRPRYLPAVPTLSERAPDRASVLGALFFREWRF